MEGCGGAGGGAVALEVEVGVGGHCEGEWYGCCFLADTVELVMCRRLSYMMIVVIDRVARDLVWDESYCAST